MNLADKEFLALSQTILDQGCRLRFRAFGTSMSPLILDGAILEVEPLPGADLRVGEVAFYRSSGGRLVAHRVIRKKFRQGRPLLLIKGDALSCQYEEVYPHHILGRVVRVEQKGRNRDLHLLQERVLGKFLAYLAPWLPWLGKASHLLGEGSRLRLKARLIAVGYREIT